jgi:SAM-dependent methyltransferase
MGKVTTLATINGIAKAYKEAIVVLSANELNLFAFLCKKGYSALELSKKLKLNKRGLTILLDTLVHLKFLTKKFDKYSCIKQFKPYLSPDGDYYIGDSLKHDLDILKKWAQLPEVIKTGLPARKEKRAEKEQRDFILSMANSTELSVSDFFNHLDLSKCKTFFDIGGGPGTNSIFAVHKYPHLKAYSFDLPETIKIAREYLKQFIYNDTVKLIEGDYFKNDFGKDYDSMLLSNIIHSHSEADILKLFKKVYKSCSKTGKLIVKDFFINDNRVEPKRAVLFAINMLVNTEAGNTYSVNQINALLKKAGFKRTKYVFVNDNVEFIEAYK